MVGGASQGPIAKGRVRRIMPPDGVGDGLRRMYGDIVDQAVPTPLAELFEALEEALSATPSRDGEG